MRKLRQMLKIFAICAVFWLVFPIVGSAAEEVWVIGHKSPDMDSICSALGYAALKQQLGMKALAVSAGDMNKETLYALNYFGVQALPVVKAFAKHQKVILVDHNEPGQSLDGLGTAEIVEIVDHHRLGGLVTEKPVYVHLEATGSTATIVANLFWQRQLAMPKEIAGLLLSAILSDTVLFQSPTSTDKDKETAERLADIAGVTIENYGYRMLKTGADVSDETPDQLVRRDMKEFAANGKMFSVSQVSVMDSRDLLAQKEQLLLALEKLRSSAKYEASFFMVTNIAEKTTRLLYQGNVDAVVKKAFGQAIDHYEVYLPNVMSRKSQIVPQLLSALNELRNIQEGK